MNFITSHNSLEKLYELSLNSIKDIKFTFREIDVIACIMNNKREKKIAALLFVAPKTVSAHVYNIMGKLGFNAKDQIIDFIESSDKLNIIKEYYLHLLVKSNFEQKLIKIASCINREKLDCYYIKNDKINIPDSLYHSLKKHLRMANILVHDLTVNDSENKLTIELNNISEENYYNDLLQILSEIISSPMILEISTEYHDSYKQIKDAYEGKLSHLEEVINSNHNKIRLTKQNLMIILALLSITLISSYSYNYINFLSFNKAENKTFETVKALEDFVDVLKNEKFTAHNISQEQARYNHNIIKKVEKLLEYKNSHEIQEYFKKTEMSAEFLTHYLYNLQALASYYMYNIHAGSKARTILIHAKELAEQYIHGRSFKNDFDQLSNAEVLTELQIANDLPQIYTRSVYSLARTYMYDDDILLGRKYFELSKYLGNKLNLFEGYLSDLSGIFVIDKELAEINIKEGKFDIAKETLQNINILLDKMRNDDNTYILNYKPEIQEQQIIIPKKHLYNVFECNNKIIVNYSILLSISKNNAEINKYIDSINSHLIEIINKKSFKSTKEIPQKRVADLYNNLGNILIKLWKIKVQDNINIYDKELKSTIAKILSSDLSQNLELAELLFTTAKDISRSSDFTKADSYDGLALVNKLKLQHKESDLTPGQKLELQSKIEEYTNKSQSINLQLNRKTKSNG